MKTAAVVGLGLIGGSIARDLARNGVNVLGYDLDPTALRGALDAGVITGELDDNLANVAAADWFIIAVPVDRAPDVLYAAQPFLDRASLVTDVGSTKRSIVAAAEDSGLGPVFVGSHPFAGSHSAGWGAARDGLFANARVFLCPARQTSTTALAEAHALWSLCGANVEVVDAATHDRNLAWSSHAPQFLSSALAIALRSSPVAFDDTGTAARDMLRLAASDARIWTAIGLDNADNIAAALRHCEHVLALVRAAIDHGDRDALYALLHTANSYHPES